MPEQDGRCIEGTEGGLQGLIGASPNQSISRMADGINIHQCRRRRRITDSHRTCHLRIKRWKYSQACATGIAIEN